MINPKEISCGNFFMYDGKVIKITAVDIDNETVKFFDEESSEYQEVLISYLHPLEITRKTLFDNHFREDGTEFIYRNSDVIIKIRIVDKRNCLIVHGEIGSVSNPVRYIHELQNFLVLLKVYVDIKYEL